VIFKKMTENMSNIYGDTCANIWGVRRNLCTRPPELGELNLYVHTKFHVLIIYHNNSI